MPTVQLTRYLLRLLWLLCLASPTQAAEESLAPYQPRFGRERPVVAVVGQNRMTELADYVVPLGVLRRTGGAQVLALATVAEPIELMPALSLQPDASIAEFRQRFPQGADYLVVPAVHDSRDPLLLAFIQQQAALGATLIGICDGVLPLAHAGLLQGRRATGHWYSRSRRLKDFPDTLWQEDRRYVVDGALMTTSGVSAALPASLALVEAIAGHTRASTLAREFGVASWSPEHHSQGFALGAQGYLTAAGNYLARWRHERFAVTLHDGLDEVALALRVDAWARTFRTQVYGVAAHPERSASGLAFVPQRDGAGLPALPGRQVDAAWAIDEALDGIAERYGEATRRLVAAQLEHAPAGSVNPVKGQIELHSP
ncbi:DJ-1/PfpI family protein [Pseudomonas chengduensis]|nr:DJ-1/PfpI family protein [Pseudomonas chengduensis]MDH1729938.1 DJ-1/PfpI family protein [Pseudomonas chengduensis]